jgi:hypothetical protein
MTSNHNLPDLYLPSSWNYRWVLPHPAKRDFFSKKGRIFDIPKESQIMFSTFEASHNKDLLKYFVQWLLP